MGEIYFSVSRFSGGGETFNLQIDDFAVPGFILYYRRVEDTNDIWMPKASICLDFPHRLFDSFLARSYEDLLQSIKPI